MIKQIMDEGKLVPTDFTVDLLIREMASSACSSGTFLIDGFPRAVDQATMFETKLKEVDKILFYNVPQEVMEERCAERAKSSGRSDDNPETIKKRVQTYFDESLPVVDHFGERVNKIDALKSIDEVYVETQKALK